MNRNLLMISGDRALAQGKQGAFYNTLEEFHKYWDRVDIICPRVKSEKSEVKNLFGNVFIHSSPWPLLFQVKFIFRKGREIFKHHKFGRMIVHDYPPFYNGLGAYLLHLAVRVPYMLEIHHIPGYPKAASFREWIYRIFARLFIALDALVARAVRVVNKHQTKEFLIQAGVPESKIRYIPSIYIDHAVFRQFDGPKEYDLIFVGRLEKNKGIELFLETAKKTGLKALIVGDGTEKEFIKSTITGRSNITLHGWAEDSLEIARLINKSKLFVLTSYNEGGPRVVLEAMACGVPVLATPVGIVPDVKDSCVLISWNVSDIISKAQHLLNDNTAYQSQSERGLETAKRFSKESAVKNYAEEVAHLIV